MPYNGGKRDKADIRYDPSIYTPEGAKLLSDKELKAEYSRLRSIARKRLERMGQSEWKDSQAYLKNTTINEATGKRESIYKPVAQITSNRDMRHLLSDVARFVQAEQSSISGQERIRTKAIESLHEHGYEFVNKKNFRQFSEFMEYARIKAGNKMYDSSRIADFFGDVTEKKKLSNKQLFTQFNKWKKEQKKEKKIQHKNPRNSEQYRKDMGWK